MDCERFLNDRVALYAGDCLNALAQLAENSIDSCVTDPPYHLTSGNQSVDWSSLGTDARGRVPTTNKNGRGSKTGFMGKQWDGGDIAFRPDVWIQVLRVLRPGGHLLAFGGTRTYDMLCYAIRQAGFEIRDAIMWIYGSGFPKSRDVSKDIDRAAGAEREITATIPDRWAGKGSVLNRNGRDVTNGSANIGGVVEITTPTTAAARQWEGWGTALKPATEIICVARKPLSERTVAANVLRWGTGALNIDGCRVAARADDNASSWGNGRSDGSCWSPGRTNGGIEPEGNRSPLGRWPANVVLDGSEEVVGAFPETGISSGGHGEASQKSALAGDVYGKYSGATLGQNAGGLGDSGSAARFFYTAKADSDDRLGSKHPTVKPLDLMQYLVRLVTPRGGTCLDLFAGTGTTGEAAWREGMSAVLIEREAEYQQDIRRRMALALAGPAERTRESIKAKNLARDDGPLFGWGQ
jgi:site-specific DNA-methyltransferase (adenine-specific)